MPVVFFQIGVTFLRSGYPSLLIFDTLFDHATFMIEVGFFIYLGVFLRSRSNFEYDDFLLVAFL